MIVVHISVDIFFFLLKIKFQKRQGIKNLINYKIYLKSWFLLIYVIW